MEKDKLWHLLKRFLVISVIVTVAVIKFTAKFLYVLITVIGESSSKSPTYTYGSGLGYNNFSFYRWWWWRRRWGRFWE